MLFCFNLEKWFLENIVMVKTLFSKPLPRAMVENFERAVKFLNQFTTPSKPPILFINFIYSSRSEVNKFVGPKAALGS